jgi:hypothetical protein
MPSQLGFTGSGTHVAVSVRLDANEPGLATRVTTDVLGLLAAGKVEARSIVSGMFFGPPPFGLGGHARAGFAATKLMFPGTSRFESSPSYDLQPIAEKASQSRLAKFAKRWRTGHVDITIAGAFDDAALADIDRAAITALRRFKPIARPPAPALVAAPRTRATSTVDGPTGQIGGFVVAQSLAIPDRKTESILSLFASIANPRIDALVDRTLDRHATIVLVTTGPSLIVSSSFEERPAADITKLAAAVEAELRKLITDGPTTAELDAAKITAIKNIGWHTDLSVSELFEDLESGRSFSDRAAAARDLAALDRKAIVAAWKSAIDPDALLTVLAGSIPSTR